jgi:membrane-bound lytic murein transglycosylase D
MRITLRLFIILFAFVALKTFTGCSGSDVNEEESEETKKIKDSTQIYAALENARIHYTNALHFNEKADSKSSTEEFETAVKQLYQIDSKTLSTHYGWNKDFEELSKSVAQDYLIANPEVSDNSKVFKLADRVGVKYEKVEKKTYTNSFDPADLPKGDEIKLEKNSYVDDYITYFQGNGRKYMDKWLYRSGKYFNLMRSILRENNAPEELIYLSMIESGLDPSISSWAGAIGLWQFMPATGSSYGLYYDENTDDKRDVEKSTDAAAKLLKDLHKSFGDWYLALASYNCGPGRVTSAMQKTGSNSFWDVRDYLPKETRNYVPQFIACALITIDPKKYGFKDVEYGTPLEYDRVLIKAEVSVQRLAELCNTNVETIRELNSQMLKDVTPVFSDGYLVKIPKGSFKEFSRNYEAADDFDKHGYKATYDGNEGTASVDRESSYSYYKVDGYQIDDPKLIISQSNRELVFHQMGETDDLRTVSIKYSVRPSDLRIWNNISYGKYPKTGDSLSVWLTASTYKEMFGVKDKVEEKLTTEVKKDDVKKEEVETNEKKEVTENNQQIELPDNNGKEVLVRKENTNNNEEETTEPTTKKEKKEKVTKTKSTNKGSYLTYTVKSGDNLSKIADDYNVEVSDIKEWNDLSSDQINIGQKLKLYTESKTTTKVTKTSKKNSKKTEYTVKAGDNLTLIADKYDVDIADLRDWNDLESDKIYSGQVLVIYSDKKTTSKTEKTKTKAKTYTVKSGDNLSSIADEFEVTVDQIKDWNDLESDKIYSGQVLKLYAQKKETTKKETSKTEKKKKAQFHTVKKGETLASIADMYDVTVADLKKWNKLKSAEIFAGQKLTVSK